MSKCLCRIKCNFWVYMPESSRAGYSNRCVPRSLKNYHTDIHTDCTSFQSLQQWINVLFSQHSHQHELSFALLILNILTGVIWNPKVVLTFISLMSKDGQIRRYGGSGRRWSRGKVGKIHWMKYFFSIKHDKKILEKLMILCPSGIQRCRTF